MDQETLRILEMVQHGQITPEQAATLLDALESPSEEASSQVQRGRRFRIVVTDKASGRNRFNVSIPMALLDMAAKMKLSVLAGEGQEGSSRMGTQREHGLSGVDLQKLLEAIRGAQDGKILEADLEDDRQTHHVKVFVE